MNGLIKTAHDDSREFLEVCDWESFQYSGSHKKPEPPWRWFRVHVSFMNSPIWQQMTKPQRSDFVSLLSLASQCGNLINADAKWLRLHGISSKTLATLTELQLIRRFSLPGDDQKIKNLRRVFSGGTRAQSRREGEEVGVPPFQRRGEETTPPAPAPEIKDFSPPSPRVPIEEITAHMNAAGASKQQGAHDPRSFEDLKTALRPVALQLGTTDAHMIHRLAGQKLRMSLKQCTTAVNQLVEDGELSVRP